MGSAPSDNTLVRHVRTFADDVRRAQGEDASPKKAAVQQEKPRAAAQPPQPDAAPAPPLAIDDALITPVAERAGNASHLADTRAPLDIRKEAAGEAGEAVIVSDKRRKRWSLFRAIGSALGAWTRAASAPPDATATPAREHKKKSAAENIRRKHAEEVARAEIRERTKQRAAEQAANARTASDRPSTPRRAQSAEPVPRAIKDIAPAAAPLPDTRAPAPRSEIRAQPPEYKHATPRAAADIETPDNLPTAEHTIEQAATTGAGSARAAEAHTPAPQSAAEEQPEAANTAAERRAAIEKMLAARVRDAAAVTPHQPPAADPVPQNVQPAAPAMPPEAPAAAQPQRSVALHEQPSALSLRPFVVAGITMIIVMLAGGFGFFWYAQESGRGDVATVRIPTFIAIDTQQRAPFSENRAVLLENLTEAVSASSGTVAQIYLAREHADRAVETADFMRVLDPRAPGSFMRNLSPEMMFGAYAQSEPFFIFRTDRFDTAFAGMLDWEPFMSADLTPLFGEPVSRSFDPSARSGDQTRTAFFTDEVIESVTARTLYDAFASERIVYAFADQHTLIITTSKEALRALLSRF